MMMTGTSFGANIGLTVFFHEYLGLTETTSFGVTLFIVFLSNFFLMRYYVYGASNTSPRRQFSLYLASSLGFRGLEYVSFLVVHTLLNIQYIIGIVGVLGGSFLVKFIWYRKIVFIPVK